MGNYKINKSGSLQVSSKKNQEKTKKNNNLLIVNSLGIGYYIIVPILVGTFLGYWIDNKFHIKPIAVLIGIITGTIASFYNLFKMTVK